MSIDKNTVRKVAKLARIRISDAQEDKLVGEMTNIFKLIEQLNEAKTEGVEPLSSVVDMALPRRADEVTDGGIADKILANAPEHTAGFFVVPKIVE